MSRAWLNGLVLLLGALSAGCGEEPSGSGSAGGNGGADTTASAGGNGGGTTSAATTTTMVATTTTWSPTTTSGSTTTTTTGPIGECDPPAPAGSLYALSDINLNDDVVSMCKYRGDVLLIVNMAEA